MWTVMLGWSCLYTKCAIILSSLKDPNPTIYPQPSGPTVEAVMQLFKSHKWNHS